MIARLKVIIIYWILNQDSFLDQSFRNIDSKHIASKFSSIQDFITNSRKIAITPKETLTNRK